MHGILCTLHMQHKCLKSATYVVVNPCNASISSMLFEVNTRMLPLHEPAARTCWQAAWSTAEFAQEACSCLMLKQPL